MTHFYAWKIEFLFYEGRGTLNQSEIKCTDDTSKIDKDIFL